MATFSDDIFVKITKADAKLLAEACRYAQFSDITKHGNGYHHGVPNTVADALYRVLETIENHVQAEQWAEEDNAAEARMRAEHEAWVDRGN